MIKINATNKLLLSFIFTTFLCCFITVQAQEIDTEIKEQKSNITSTKEKQPFKVKATIVDLTSDKLEYIQDKNEFVATGSAKIIIKDQNSELIADKITYNQTDQVITAIGHLTITKGENTISGDFAQVKLNEKSALIKDPMATISKIRMKAKEANLYPEHLELKDGEAVLTKGNIDLSLKSNLYTPAEYRKDLPGNKKPENDFNQNGKTSFRIVAQEIELDRSRTTNNLTIKKPQIYIGKLKIATLPKLSLTIGNGAQTVEAFLPEVGFDKQIGGIYLGPSITLNPTKNSMLRISPVLSAAGKEGAIGGGGIARFSSPYNKTNIAYTTTGNKLILAGEQKLYKDTTKIKYIINEYADNGFMGMALRRPVYLTEIVDQRKIGTLLNHTLSTRSSGGLARDTGYGVTTSRIQLQGNIISEKPLLSIKDAVALRLQSQFNVATYGTGDSYAVIRGGPRLDCKLWRFDLTTTYMQAGIWGETPFVFDEFIRGTRNLILAGDFKITKFLSIGNIRSLNLSRDGSEPQLSTENQFYARVGPDDFKLKIGYDLERKRSIFGIDLFLGSGRTGIGFDKLKVIHPEKVTK